MPNEEKKISGNLETEYEHVEDIEEEKGYKICPADEANQD
jgi:hypothetical protein